MGLYREAVVQPSQGRRFGRPHRRAAHAHVRDGPAVRVRDELYSSAIFIGWGCVALGVLLERLYPIGIGNVLARRWPMTRPHRREPGE